MYRVSQETAVSTASFSARSKQARSEPSQVDGFSALVDSNVPTDTDRGANSAPDAPPQRLDSGSTTAKADNRPDTKTNTSADDGTQTRLTGSKSGKAKSDKSGQSGANNSENAKSDTAKSDAVKSDAAKASADTTASNDAAATTAEVDLAAAIAKATLGVASGHASTNAADKAADKTADTTPSSDKKTKDTGTTDVAAPAVPAVVVDASAVVAVAVSATVAIDAKATPAVKLDPQTGVIQSVATAASAALATPVATSEAKASAKSATAAATLVSTQAIPAADAQQGTSAAAGAQKDSQPVDTPTTTTTDIAAAATAATSTPAPAPDASTVTDAADAANVQATIPVSGKPKASNSASGADKAVVVNADASATDTPPATPSLPGQSAHTDAVRGAKHAAGESDNQASTADKPDAAPTETKQANASAVPPPAHGDHQAAAAVRAAPADLTLQPVQIQQTPPPQAQAQNLTVTPAVQNNATLANTPVPVSGLAVDIALRAAGGSSRFEIRLDPSELGRIDVRLDVDKHGNVTSHLTVERPATLDMLRQDAPKLQQALQDAGLKTGDSGLQFSLRDQSQGRNDDNGSGRNSQRLIISDDDAVPAQVAGRTYGRGLASSSGVDISI